MLDTFFTTYQADLQETGGHLGMIAENWETVRAKAEEARQAAEDGYSTQLRQLMETGTLGMDNTALTQGFLNAYPAIAACIDATGKFAGNLGDLRKELGKISFKKFVTASDDIESLQKALTDVRKGRSAVEGVEAPQARRSRMRTSCWISLERRMITPMRSEPFFSFSRRTMKHGTRARLFSITCGRKR